MLDRKDVDVVFYATPDIGVPPGRQYLQAAQGHLRRAALSHPIRGEASWCRRWRIPASAKPRRSAISPKRMAVELILNGRIGKLKSVIAYNYPSPYECDFPAQPIPEGLDWDRWCGPNEVVPYHTNLPLAIPYVREVYPALPAEKYAVGPGWMRSPGPTRAASWPTGASTG